MTINEQSAAKRATITLDTANADRQYPAYQLSINAMWDEHSGHGYRLMGPKYIGRSKNLRTVELKQRDADEIRGVLDEVFPPEPAKDSETDRAEAFREAARLLEETGHSDDAVNLLYTVAEGIAANALAESV
ncbi:hypothetical protein ACFVWR_18955 [Leifsonia sp. NPDC058292]|uniref:hypothetical protein n=1 Tax=Leifsonia sp. NPDC058292 TaxID=3346428 RepID=UPI0036D99E2E